MPSPDQSSYSGLTLFDKDAYQYIQQALTDANSKLPGFNPKVGSYEMIIWEGMALMASELSFAINRLVDGVMEVQMSNFGIVRDLGTPARADITLTVVDNVGYQIPAGIELRLDDGSGNSIIFQTDETANVSPLATSATISATAQTNTDDFNGTAIGTPLSIVSPVAYLETAVLNTPVSGGESVETDDEWRNRAVQLFRTMTQVLALPSHFTDKALTLPGVYRANTRDNWNVSTASTGHVTLAVADSSGTALSTETKTSIRDTLDALAQANLIVHVVDPDYNEIDATIVAKAKPGYVPSAVQADVAAAVVTYLSAATWPWEAKVRINELVSLVDQVEGVDYIEVGDIQIALGGDSLGVVDVDLIGDFPLVTPGSINVTVSGP